MLGTLSFQNPGDLEDPEQRFLYLDGYGNNASEPQGLCPPVLEAEKF